MSTIDKQRIAAVRKLEQLGYTFTGDDWMHPANGAAPAPAITDALHALLVKRADDLEGCTAGSDESASFRPSLTQSRLTRRCVGLMAGSPAARARASSS
jgi:hypothetical protein